MLGILFGATYALIGIGFTFVFGAMHEISGQRGGVGGAAYCEFDRTAAR